MDVLTPEQRQRNMRAIRGRNTKPERIIGRGLHAMGFRYRLNVSHLPGSPDLHFPKHGAVIFTHGCFWHGHDCPLFKVPATRADAWIAKIETNRCRDERDVEALLNRGLRVLTVWECSLRGRGKLPLDEVLGACRSFLLGDSPLRQVRGRTSVI